MYNVIEIVPLEKLEVLAAECSEPSSVQTTAVSAAIPGQAWGKDRLQQFIDTHLTDCKPEPAVPYDGGFMWKLGICPFNPDHTNRSAAVFLKNDGKLGFNCFHDGCVDNDWKALRAKFEPTSNNSRTDINIPLVTVQMIEEQLAALDNQLETDKIKKVLQQIKQLPDHVDQMLLREKTIKKLDDLGFSAPARIVDAALSGNSLTAQPADQINTLQSTVTTGNTSTGNNNADQVTAQKPEVILPNGTQTITAAARQFGELLDKTGDFFNRGGILTRLTRKKDLEPVKTASLPSILESIAKLISVTVKANKIVKCAAICSEQIAKLILNASAFIDAIRPIKIITPCPVLIERAGDLIQITGYDRESGILAAGEPAKIVGLEQTKELLNDILSDFRFATPADHARALAGLITPALTFGGLLKGRAPMDLGEADASQAGKGFRNKLTAAIYMQSPTAITQKKGGVGSLEETFNMALIRGVNFISLDNVRGKIDSPAIESFLTEDNYQARGPYLAPVEIDPTRVIIQMTSNKAEITPDLANRSSCVRILKQPESFCFKKYPAGDVLDHIRANQSLYLGAVFAVVKAWYTAGMPRTTETRHDFRPWAQTLDWICQNILKTCPLLDEHREVQIRMATPNLNWLRDVCRAIEKAGFAGKLLKTAMIVEIISDEPDIEVPGLSEGENLTNETIRNTVFKAVGRRLGMCFTSGDRLTVDSWIIERRISHNQGLRDDVKEYCVTVSPLRSVGGKSAAIETQCAVDAAIASTQGHSPKDCLYTGTNTSTQKSMEPMAAMAAVRPQTTTEPVKKPNLAPKTTVSERMAAAEVRLAEMRRKEHR